MNTDALRILNLIKDKGKELELLMLISRLPFFSPESLLSIWEAEEKATFICGKNAYKRMGIDIKEGESPILVKASIFMAGPEGNVEIVSKNIPLYDISQTYGVIPEISFDIEKALSEREQIVIMPSFAAESYFEKEDLGTIFYINKDLLDKKEILYMELLSLYAKQYLSGNPDMNESLIPFLQYALQMHFLKNSCVSEDILAAKLGRNSAEELYSVCRVILMDVRTLIERLSFRRLSFDQTFLVNGLLMPDKEESLLLLQKAREKTEDESLIYEIEGLIRTLEEKSNDFFSLMYKEKILNNGIYTYPYKNMEA